MALHEHHENVPEHQRPHEDCCHRPGTAPTVPIVIGQELCLHPGKMTVAELKKAGGVPLADVLNQIVGGKLVPLPDDGVVEIKGHERFVGHPKDCSSS